jgi:hypothetical protein
MNGGNNFGLPSPVETGLADVVSSTWVNRVSELRESFSSAQPFPLVVMDGFLTPTVAEGLEREFPTIDAMPRSRDYIFGNKRELSSLEESGTNGRAFHRAITSDSFQSFLLELTGWDLVVDPAFHGGGFHQGQSGSFLDMHLDFNVHPDHRDWLRTLNLLIYLNRDWRDEWGGHLLVKSRLDEEPRSIAPLFNRAVLMLTGDRTYHGYRRVELPSGVTRKSVATYAYRIVDPISVSERTTQWVPEGGGLVKGFVAHYYNRLVQTKNKLFGNATARNR